MPQRTRGFGSSALLQDLFLVPFLPIISQAVFESNWTGVRELSPPKSLQAEFAGQRKGLTFNGSTNAEFHWVVTACDIRPGWALSMTTTILHGLLHGVNPTTLSVVWCKHYNNKSVPMELYNLRHSKSWNVLFIPKNMQPKTQRERSWVSYVTALSVPDILQRPELPVLVTEDDVLFTLDFGKKLNDMIRQMKEQSGGKPYVATLYSADPNSLDTTEKVLAKYMEDVRQGKHSPRPCQREGTCSTGVQAVRGKGAYMYASLAMLYSPESRKLLMTYISQVIAQSALGRQGHPTDVLIGLLFRFQLKCSAGGDCELFRAVPSMVEHTGTLSAMRGTLNRRFHTSADFPFEVAFPMPNLTALNGNLSLLNSGDGYGDGTGAYGNVRTAASMSTRGGLRVGNQFLRKRVDTGGVGQRSVGSGRPGVGATDGKRGTVQGGLHLRTSTDRVGPGEIGRLRGGLVDRRAFSSRGSRGGTQGALSSGRSAGEGEGSSAHTAASHLGLRRGVGSGAGGGGGVPKDPRWNMRRGGVPRGAGIGRVGDDGLPVRATGEGFVHQRVPGMQRRGPYLNGSGNQGSSAGRRWDRWGRLLPREGGRQAGVGREGPYASRGETLRGGGAEERVAVLSDQSLGKLRGGVQGSPDLGEQRGSKADSSSPQSKVGSGSSSSTSSPDGPNADRGKVRDKRSTPFWNWLLG
ncbi:hypothetical protein DUNSADRAFT_4513 [Dunaliella salina]|uniref:Uncharacterized protein n=1 Tax=Dunaliella salina TaxID=3046 RepID=A0ABQ7GRW4_DUNSA|nr:hypothetical protein DUNSADRAFT_4513 [Dunaliella salina]|eukprot:KAF5837354.1 hypothetical protein DUNSADRAFT_4513 [Dunaliella salina]